MKKYNYFDDKEEIEERRFDKLSKSKNVKEFLLNLYVGVSVAVRSGIGYLRHSQGKKTIIARLVLVFILLLLIAGAVFSFAYSINAHNARTKKFNESAGKVCTEYIQQYGATRWESLDEAKYGENQARLTGLCYARQMDFNHDGSDELMLCYYSKNAYYLEVWGFDGDDFKQFYADEANSTNQETDGYWVGFYHNNNKYYICKSEKDNPEQIRLFALRHNKFRETSSKFDYDYKNDIYARNGKINSTDFETIKLSVFRKTKGDILVDLVTSNIDKFGSVSMIEAENKKSKEQLKAEAYFSFVAKRLEKYGKPKVVTDDGVSYIDGVALAQLIDFDKDGNEELFVVYRKPKMKSKYDYGTGGYINYEVPSYSMEVYNWNGTVANRIFSKDSICTYTQTDDTFFVILANGEKSVNICNNTFTAENTYSYTASSKIYKLKKGAFDTVYSAKIINDYGYKQYYLNNERVYQSSFEQKGYRVPFFMNDEDTFDASKYTVTYLSGQKAESYKATVNETVKTLQSLNSEFTVEESK